MMGLFEAATYFESVLSETNIDTNLEVPLKNDKATIGQTSLLLSRIL